MRDVFRKRPSLLLGTYGSWWWPQAVRLLLHQATTHMHVIGVSGSGKSRFLAGLYLDLLTHGLPATLIDPHGDLARLILAHLVAAGFYDQPGAYQRLVYLDLPAAERAGRFLPFNVLAHTGSAHTIAANVKDAFHRAWPQLAGGAAPMFDTLVQDGVKVLVSNTLPLTALYRLLTDKPFRDSLLAAEDDPDVVAFFHDQFDRLSLRDQADQAGAALRRAHLLTFAPVLKYSLGQRETVIDWRTLLDSGSSCIINLALADAEARRLFGCLLTVFAEHAALSRAELTPTTRSRLPSHHLVIDEFSQFSAQSAEAFARMLSETRKYGLHLVYAHQTWSQVTDPKLRGATQNAGIEIGFRQGRSDAEYSALLFGRADPQAVKHMVSDADAAERTHPVFYSLPEQWEQQVQALQDLPARQAFVRIPDPAGKGAHIHRITTKPVPDPLVAEDELAMVEAHYLETYFRPQAEVEQALAPLRATTTPASTNRRRRLEVTDMDD